MTKKLYYQSSYIKKWTTTIKRKMEVESEKFVVLEETAFYPHGGGQPSDTGRIGTAYVLDVFQDGDDVVHRVDTYPETNEVECEINWSRRFDHMQQHSGQHLLSAVCRGLLDAPTLSFHLGAEDVTIDVNKPEISASEWLRIEEAVNQEIYHNRTIASYFVTSEELNHLSVVKLPTVTENIRIVEIEGIEHNACGGTHVASTGEIGLIKLYKKEKQKGGTRIYFKCGARAMADYRKHLQLLNAISNKFNTNQEQIMDRLDNWEKNMRYLEEQLHKLKEENDDYLAKHLLHENKGKFIAHVCENKSAKDTQVLAEKIAKENKITVLFVAKDENKVVLSRGGDSELSCGKFFKQHLSLFNGRGGGNDRSAQAGFSNEEDMQRFFMFAEHELRAMLQTKIEG
ncbi:DHHA1 domain-containing protein [Fictibacillus iocasae]|uniref:DHHA1 domain-containing protein n=1 Tax=Fictibacillus iocasae TaxID=2715437 RepID=A0ABW2NJC8_9BACL